MKLFLYIHHLITLLFILIPFLPLIFIIRYKIYLIPILLTIYWLIFETCQLSKLHKNKIGYTEDLVYNLFNVKITKRGRFNIIAFCVCLVPTIILIRLINTKC